MKQPVNYTVKNNTVNTNVCKNDRCENLAKVDSTDYIFPSYHLGFPALHCNKCGSNALLLNNDDINLILQPKINFYLTQVKGYCLHCYHENRINYGTTQKLTSRYKCKHCNQVYSPKQLTHRQRQQLLKLSHLLFTQASFSKITQCLNISYSYFYHLLAELTAICQKIV